MLGQTKAFCEAALPVLENKKKVWNGLFAGEYDSMSLKNIGELCAGFKQRSHLDLISELQDEFFDKILHSISRDLNIFLVYFIE